MGDPLHLVRTPHFDAIFMLGADDDLDTVDNVDVLVTFPDRTRYSATVVTLPAIQRWINSEPEEFDRLHFQCPDLLITRHAGVPAMMRIFEMAHARNELRELLDELRPSSPDEDGDSFSQPPNEGRPPASRRGDALQSRGLPSISPAATPAA